MITEKDLLTLREEADKEVAKIDKELTFDHFAIKTPNKETYEKLCSLYGGKSREVFQSGRNIATITNKCGLIEIMEPKKDEDVERPLIHHVGYVSNRIDDIGAKAIPISKFELGNTTVMFIKLSDFLIQIRSRSLKDYEG